MIKPTKFSFLLLLLAMYITGYTQEIDQEDRLDTLREELKAISATTLGLTQTVDFNIDHTKLTDFVRAMADLHGINISLENSLNNLQVTNNFSNATVADVLLFLCKSYSLTIDFTGNILYLKKYQAPKKGYKFREIPIQYTDSSDLITLDLKHDSLSVVFKKIADLTGKNLVFTPGLGHQKLSGYFKNMPLKDAIEKLSFANNLEVEQTRNGVYMFEPGNHIPNTNQGSQKQRPIRNRSSNFYYQIQDTLSKQLEVDFENTDINAIIHAIGVDLKIDMFTTAPLKEAGKASVKAHTIDFDLLLDKLFENTDFTYKKQNEIYFFGKNEQLSLRNNVTIPLMHRSIEIMSGQGNVRSGSNYGNAGVNNNQNNYTRTNYNNNSNNFNTNSNATNRQNINTQNNAVFGKYTNNSEALVNILPKDIISNLEIKTDLELNSFIVSGPSQNINRFREFIATIDKPIPVILIEVMFIEYKKNATIETGVDWGIGNEPTTTQGALFPGTDLSLGEETINKIIGGFNGFGTLNLGKVVPNFYATIKAMENNGAIDITSTPKLSTLNGHRASLAIGETTYYVVTNTDYIGSQIPQTSTITNYQPINAEMALHIMPLVSGDGSITMSLNVIQSSFNDTRIDEQAPPGMNSREFSSTIRVKNQDVIILGGLEEEVNSNSGSGVPFLAKIPLIKWLFSSQKKEDKEKKLSILIKPTIIK